MTDRNYFYIANALVRRGHKVLYLNWDDGSSIKDMDKVEFDFAQIKYRLNRLSPQTVDLIKKFKPDIVHLLTPRYRNIITGSIIQEMTGAPLVLHQGDEYSFELKRFLDSASIEQKIKYFIGDKIIKRLLPGKWFLYDNDAYLNNMHRISAMDCMPQKLTERIAQSTNGRILVKTLYHTVIEPSVFEKCAARRKHAGETSHVKFTSAGYVTSYNIAETETLLKAFRLCIDNGYDNIKLILTGKIQKNITPELHNMIKSLRLDNHVVHKGFIENELDFFELVSSCDIAVIPGNKNSANEYRFPSKIVPYMCMGMPIIISSAYGFCRDLSDDEVVKTEPDNPRELMGKMAMLINNKEMRRTLSRKAREKAKRYFRPADKVAEEFEKFYAGILTDEYKYRQHYKSNQYSF
jgi:glycosyltransferase involved in cell wall biosynthesis